MLKNKARFYLIMFVFLPAITVILYRTAIGSMLAFLFIIIFGLNLAFLKCKHCNRYLTNYSYWPGRSMNYWSKVIVKNVCPRCGKYQGESTPEQ